ncbi:MAG: hypothetical protein C4326_13400 [Ignavibacteria bacterium]
MIARFSPVAARLPPSADHRRHVTKVPFDPHHHRKKCQHDEPTERSRSDGKILHTFDLVLRFSLLLSKKVRLGAIDLRLESFCLYLHRSVEHVKR